MNLSDIYLILRWFFIFLLIGVAFLPLTFSLFSNFKDKGYIFSKIIGTIFLSYFVFILGLLKLVKFSEVSVYFSLLILFLINYSIFLYRQIDIFHIIKKNLKIFIVEEIIFLLTLTFWSYVRSNLPDIHGLEKFMDFGFLNSILRADYFPPKDMWYTPLPINYYYFGHLATAVITKLTFIPSFISYNLMISTLFAFTFSAGLSIIMNLFDNIKFSKKSTLAGFISAIIITFGGNLTTIYTLFKAYPNDHPVPFWKLPFLPTSFPNGYWYPNATRFIPFTIHEFPIYSFVVSDLHGHVLDIPLVLLTIATIFSLFLRKKINIFHLIFISFLCALMYMTNAWDGFIYLLLSFLFLFIYNFYIENEKFSITKTKAYKFFKEFLILISGFLVFFLPFSINFKPFVSGIGVLCAPTFLTNLQRLGPFLFEANHCQKSPIWQLSLLYGGFYFFVVCFLIFLKFKKNYKITRSDFFVTFLILLSTLLIIIPEFLYVKDIYPLHYRANTMFKLTYESFMMLSLCLGYIFVKLVTNIKRKKILFSFAFPSFIILALILIYPIFAINSYYRDLKTYENLNGINYLQTLYPQDYDLINWINQNIKGQPVILEASGDSYTDYARISANTGLPTVVGWSVHEWLWRGTYDIVSPRIADVETLYTNPDMSLTKSLIKKYNIKYIVISSLERQKYPNLDEEKFSGLGKIIYKSQETLLYKINF
jgi:YYY domain-containing protein